MTEYLSIKARLPKPAGLELSARLTAARPQWDIAATEDGLSFIIPLIHGRVDEDLGLLEEACQNLERLRIGLEVELEIGRVFERPESPAPAAAGPWRISLHQEGEKPEPGLILLPPGLGASGRLWAGAALLLTALADHLTPPPGAPETRFQPVLMLENGLPLSPAAARQAQAGSLCLITDEDSALWAGEIMALNGLEEGGVEILTGPFKSLARQKPDWEGRFGLITLHLSPYLAARRFKTLANWLAPGGAVIVSGFAPGPQTAHLLRSAGKAGLCLAGSVNEDDWAAMRLEKSPPREELPPLTGTVVPDLMELPPEAADGGPEPAEAEDQSLRAADEGADISDDSPDDLLDEESLIITEEDDDE